MQGAEQQIRADLAALYRIVAMFGWDDLIFTHISARLPGDGHRFLINPLGLMFEEITASSLVVVDLDGRVVNPPEAEINAAGFTIHSAIHAARDDAQFVIHLHTIDGMAVAAQSHGLLPLNQASLTVIPTLSYHAYEGIALDLGECARIVRDLGDCKTMILRNHGTLAVGSSAGEAWTNIYYLERSCALQNRALHAGLNALDLASAAAQSHVASQARALKEDSSSYGLIWSAMLRKLEKKPSDFAH